MKKGAWNKRSGGFTVVELLAVVAIMVILMGIAMVSVFRYRDLLKITELDNAAREIYMAAENRAVLLSGSRRLSNQIKDAGDDNRTVMLDDGSEGVYVSKAQVKAGELLTPGSIDPALMDSEGDFYIIYQSASGSVVGVFYAESLMDDLVNNDFPAFYEKWGKDRSERLKLKDEMLVGYYNGLAGEGIQQVNPDEASVRVIIKNEEKLTVTVECTLPDPGMAAYATLQVKLGKADGSGYVNLDTKSLIAGGPRYSFTWVLDSLTEGEKQFRDWNISGFTPGDDFSVRATVSTTDNSFMPATRTATDNSLFEKGSGGDTARIKYLRHLQNLDAGFSGVEKKTKAVQTGDEILCTGNGTYGDYDFIPINNSELTGYNGGEKLIRGLYVSGKKSGHAGLFAETANGMSLEGVRLMNASVAADADHDAGALVGHANGSSTFKNCRVCWEPGENESNYPITGKNAGGLVGCADGKTTVTDCQVHWEVPGTDLIDELGSDVEGSDQYKYQIIGTNAGGLVGYAKNGCDITKSLAAVLAKGTSCAGGLAGVLESGTATVRTSYADCYLKGGEKAAGLFGDLKAETAADLTDCYAAGYIMGGTAGAGLCAGDGSTTTKNVYSVVRYPDHGVNSFFDMTQSHSGDHFTNTYFLGVGKIGGSGGTEAVGAAYETMTDNKANSFAQTMGVAFAWKNTDSHPYNLREHLTLTIYSYPGLKDLPHYGDWSAQFKEPSLVYYEEYNHARSMSDKNAAEENWGVSGGNARDLIKDLAQNNEGLNGKTVTSDGYGVAFLRSDYKSGDAVIRYYDESGNQLREQTVKPAEFIPTKWANDDGSAKGEYYLIPLPKDMIDQEEAEPDFYRYLKFDLQLAGSELISGAYYFNPHFADTVKPIAEGVTLENLLGSLREILIRTPRHLKDLSKFKDYYHNQNRTFRQALSLDYTTYDSCGIKASSAVSYVQKPIGGPGSAEDSDDDSFVGVYDGGCNTIKGVIFTSPNTDDTLLYEGLFGCSQGTLRNIVYEMNPEEALYTSRKGLSNSAYVGALVGCNRGAVRNCAVSGVNLTVQASGAAVYAGGLAGLNNGRIEDCAAECANLAVSGTSYAKLCAGGLVGSNESSRSISTSYAVGRIKAEVDSTISEAEVCGFVGRSAGIISYSYAAADLQVSGGNADVFGFCGSVKGVQVGNVYMNQGNFSYRNIAYAAKYERNDASKPGEILDVAASASYQDMVAAGRAEALHMAALWSGGEPNPKKQFPYPTGVTDKNGNPCHYGDWPKMMPLGQMGVFYWEKMVDASDSESNPSYHLSALAVDPGEGTIVKQSTLSEAHNDGRAVVDYGYGYYLQDEVENDEGVKVENKVTFSAANIGYTGYLKYDERKSYLGPHPIVLDRTRDPNSPSDKREIDAEDGLVKLMDGYTFHCWNTYREAPKAANENDDAYRGQKAVSGLYLYKASEDMVELDPNSGSFTLEQGTLKVEFCINPQFADSMSVRPDGADGLTVTGGATTVLPGETATNSYQVRSGLQLQDINWYDTAYTDVPVGLWNYSVTRFPYLNKVYFWKQTHDIDWSAERKSYKPENRKDAGGITYNNENGVFFPIAQGFVRDDTGTMSGGFSGTYDGGSYTLINFNVGINEHNYQINAIGLFGYVKNAVLTDIVMFSESGNDVVTVGGRSTNKNDDNARLKNNVYGWYAGGVLAGVAENSTISNCAVAGYTLRDETTFARYETKVEKVESGKGSNKTTTTTTTKSYDVGGAIGGLVGMTDMGLKNCTASTKIVIACDHGDSPNAPIRVGGLVGSTTATVENCYTGGQIILGEVRDEKGNVLYNTPVNAYICAGRLIGGVGTEPVAKETKATVQNCYSYLNLPKADGVVKEIYRIGGLGFNVTTDIHTVVTDKNDIVISDTYTTDTKANPNQVTLDNNYYLNSSGASGDGDGTSVSYRQLSGTDEFQMAGLGDGDMHDIYYWLNLDLDSDNPEKMQDPKPFNPVTTHIGKLPVKGRYSFVPTSREDLQGLDYPFPTVLKMEDYGAQRNVHYGAWTISGILRDKGGEPIDLDMFTEKSVTEQLKLSEGLKDGTWSAKSESDAVTVEPNDGKPGAWTITGKRETDPVDVTVTYTEEGGVTYDLTIQVYVRAEVSLTPDMVRIFPNDTFTLSPTGYNKNNGTGGKLEIQKVEGTIESISAVVPENDNSKIELAWVVPKDDNSEIQPTPGGGQPADRLWLTVTYHYTENGYTKENASHNLELELRELPAPAWDDEGKVWTIDFSACGPTALDAAAVPEGFTKEVKDGKLILTKAEDTVVPVTGIEVPITLTLVEKDAGADAKAGHEVNHTLTVTVLPKEGTQEAAAFSAEAVPVPEERAVPAEESQGKEEDESEL